MKKENLLEKFNNPGNILVISEYGKKVEYRDKTALSGYSENTIISLSKYFSLNNRDNRFVILANIVKTDEIYGENGNLFIRCYKRNSLISYLRLIRYFLKFRRIEKVLFEFEFSSYGEEKVVVFIPFLLLLARVMGKKVFFVEHQVVTDIKKLYVHLGLSKSSPKLKFLQIGITIFYWLNGLLSYKVIVLEEELKNRLKAIVSDKKIIVVPHGVEKIKIVKNRNYYRKILDIKENDFVLLCFGYITWYKGIDNFIKMMSRMPEIVNGKRIKLIIAGGKSVAQEGKSHYENYFNYIKRLADKNNILFTGFVPDRDIEKYFQTSDLCVFPYRSFISSSGPLSLAISYKKPFILSGRLKNYLRTDDFKKAFMESGLTENELFINIKPDELIKIISLSMEKKYKTKAKIFIESLYHSRSWNKLATNYTEVIFDNIGQKARSPLTRENINFGEAY